MSELSDRLFRVAWSGVVPADDQHVIADAQGEIERLSAIINDIDRTVPVGGFPSAVEAKLPERIADVLNTR